MADEPTRATRAPPVRRALVVVDVQNEYVGGALRIGFPEVRESLPRIECSMDFARARRMPIVVARQWLHAQAPVLAAGSAGAELHPGVARRHRDHLVTRELPSCFAGTGLAAWLRSRQVDTLSIVGYTSHLATAVTARVAIDEGFAVEFLHDATGALPLHNRAGAASAAEVHRVACVLMQSAQVAVLGADEWIDAVTRGTTPARDDLVASHRRAASGGA